MQIIHITSLTLPPQEATTCPAEVSHDDNVQSLGDPGPLSTIGSM